MKLVRSYAYLKKDLNTIESALESTVIAEHKILHEASLQLLKAGGKRLRPVFALLASKFGNASNERVTNVASTLELIHMASLVHDDVIDNSNLRRGKPTVKAKWDNRIAMFSGDFIFARALERFTTVEDKKAHEVLSHTMIELTLGEIEQIKDKHNFDQNLRTYLRRIKRKTALLISSSCQLGAIAGRCSPQIEKALFRYGYFIGMSYQIIDDILDFTATEAQLGKPAGSDLLQGNITLPVFYAIENSELKQDLIQYFHKNNNDEISFSELLNRIKESNAIERSRELSNQYLQKAYDSLAYVPECKAKDTLLDIANYIGARQI